MTLASPPSEHPALVSLAFAALERAYAPYSGFRVGAAIRAEDGRESSGCNVENASFPAGICAERAALAAAVVGGATRFTTLVVASEAQEPTPPCGVCRQALVEFAPSLEILAVTKGGRHARWRLDALLPAPFTPALLRRE